MIMYCVHVRYLTYTSKLKIALSYLKKICFNLSYCAY